MLAATYAYDAWGNIIAGADYSGIGIDEINPIRYRSYYYDVETGLYYLNSRYYDPETGRFINADNTKYLAPETLGGLSLYVYCLNNPVNMTDENGNLPSWLGKALAIVAVVVAAVAVTAAVATGAGAVLVGIASVTFGTACGGLVGGLYNESKGESFENGWMGGATSGFIQSLSTVSFGPIGTIVGGGFGSGLGTYVTENLNNQYRPNDRKKTHEQIVNASINSAVVASVISTLTAGIGYAVDKAVLTRAMGLMPEMTPGFGEMMKGFFGSMDDALVYYLTD